VVAGRYRVNSEVPHTPEQLIELVRFLVAQAGAH
jgi:hypothetical protein